MTDSKVPEEEMEDNRPIDGFDIFMQVILTLMILLPPLALGAVAPWARSVLFALSVALLSCWLAQGALRGRYRVARSPVWLFIMAFSVLALAQLIPLSPSVIEMISPVTFQSYARALSDYPASGEARTLSRSPYAGRMEIVRLATLVIVFFIVVNVIRTRRQAVGIILALIAIGSFEALYGFSEQFSGRKHIFWLARQYHLPAVTGTFHNKNHFAGLLEMVVPVCLGLVFALGGGRGKTITLRKTGGKIRDHLLAILSSPAIYQQAMLVALAVVMLLAIFFSLSRAAILGTFISLAAFIGFFMAGKGSRRYSMVIILIAAIVLIISAAIGVESVVTAVEDAVGGRSISWAGRVELARGALDLIKDYPILGTGLGTFGTVFPGYQPARFGDKWADFLHNDWLQAFCEMGLAGGLIVAAGAVVLVASLLRSTMERKDTFWRWIAVGGLLGVSAMLLHTFFDYNLSKITSNGVIFSVVAGLSFAAAKGEVNLGGPVKARYWIPRIGTMPARMAMLGVTICIAISGLCFAIPPAVADIHFNRYLAASASGGGADDYFFIPSHGNRHRRSGPMRGFDDTLWAGPVGLEEALRLQPHNPRYLLQSAYDSIGAADDLVRSEAAERARMILGKELTEDDSIEFQRIVAAFEAGIRPETLAQRAPFLLLAEEFLLHAIDEAPTAARHHMALAGVLADLGQIPEEIFERAEVAVAFAPAKPAILYEAGRIFLALAPSESFSKDPAVPGRADEYFRRAIFSDASYAADIYPLLGGQGGAYEALAAVTPPTVPAYERLCTFLWQAGDWEGVVACVNGIDEMLDQGDSAPIRLSAGRRRCSALGIMGRWSERAEAVSRYRGALRNYLGESMTEVHRLRGLGRNREALAICLDALAQDWGHPQALLEAAELSSHPGVRESLPEWNGPFDHLYRLVINNSDLSPADYERVLRVLDGEEPRSSSEKILAEFVRGAGAILAGKIDRGTDTLGALARGNDEAVGTWRQKHLIWFYLGQGYEKMGRDTEAVEAYAKTVEIVPTHRSALSRLGRIADLEMADIPERLEPLTPEVACDIDFGGKVKLLGYTFAAKAAPVGINVASPDRDAWLITLYWQFNDRMSRGYRPAMHFCDEDWGNLFQKYSPIRFNNDSYPVDFPRCGEVIVETHVVNHDLTMARYLRMGIWTATPGRFVPEVLHYDAGNGLVRAALPRARRLTVSRSAAG